MTQAELARAIGDLDPRLRRTEGKHVGKWEKDAAPRLAFYVVDAIAQATRTPLHAFSAWQAGLDEAEALARSRAEDLGGEPGQEQRRAE